MLVKLPIQHKQTNQLDYKNVEIATRLKKINPSSSDKSSCCPTTTRETGERFASQVYFSFSKTDLSKKQQEKETGHRERAKRKTRDKCEAISHERDEKNKYNKNRRKI